MVGGGLIGIRYAAPLAACTSAAILPRLAPAVRISAVRTFFASRLLLSDTIVAGNTGVVGQPDDIGGTGAGAVTG